MWTALALTLILIPAGGVTAGAECGHNIGATTVPECRDEVPGYPNCSLWPIDPLTNEVKFSPASKIPSIRDSTGWPTTNLPNAITGYEFFVDVAVPGDREGPGTTPSPFLYVAYTNGIQIWDVSSTPEDPVMRVAKDVWRGNDWLGNVGGGEEDQYVNALDVIQASTSEVWIAVAAKGGVGVGFFKFNTSTKILQPFFQALGAATDEIRLVEYNNRIYAFAASFKGIGVYDVTAAHGLGTCEVGITGDVVSSCPGVFQGYVGNAQAAAYIDAMVRNGTIYIAEADANRFTSWGVRVWSLTDPTRPEAFPGGAAFESYAGLNMASHSPKLFEYKNEVYLAAVENPTVSGQGPTMGIWEITDCFDGNCGNSLGPQRAFEQLTPTNSSANHLTVTFRNGAPYLHYGFSNFNAEGTGHEHLWELERLPQNFGNNQLPEVTDGGDTYTDPCSGTQGVDYFADYYPGNEYGLDRYSPRHGRFNGDYFYRAGHSIFDVHKFGGIQQSGDPIVKTQLTSTGGGAGGDRFWFDNQISFDTQVFNCSAATGEWCWKVTYANGDVSHTPGLECLSGYTGEHTLDFACSGTTPCTETTATIEAWNTACGTPGAESKIPETVVLVDPRLQIVQAGVEGGGNSFPQCQQVPLEGTAGGRGGASWSWFVDGIELEGCSGQAATNVDMSTVPIACTWDTTEISIGPEIFLDDFESGSLSAWTNVVGAASEVLGVRAKRSTLAAKVGVTSQVELRLFNGGGGLEDSQQFGITINEVGNPAFANPSNPIDTVEVAGSAATITVPAVEATIWSWEFEDPQGAGSCTFGGVPGQKCSRTTTSVDQVTYGWLLAGTYDFNVTITNCKSPEGVTASGSVTVQEAASPTIVSFSLDPDFTNGTGDACSGNPLSGFTCTAGQTAHFVLETLEEGSFIFGFDWQRAPGESSVYQNKTPDSSNGKIFKFTHVFTQTGTVEPKARSSNGAVADEATLTGAPITIN